MDQPETRVYDQDEQEKEEDGAGGGEVEGHVRTAQHHVAVGGAGADADRHDRSGQQGPEGHTGTRTGGRVLSSQRVHTRSEHS